MPAVTVLSNCAMAAALVAVFLALGARIRRLFRLPVTRGLRAPVEFVVGAWAASCVFLLQALFGLTAAPWFGVSILALAVAGRWRNFHRSWSGSWFAVIGGALPLIVAIGPPVFYDAMVYHLGLPWQVLRDGGLIGHPENLFSAFPPSAQLLALPVLAMGFFRVPAILHWCAWIVAAVAIHETARRAGAPVAARRTLSGIVLILPVAPLVPGFSGAEAWLLAPLFTAVALVARKMQVGTPGAVGLLMGFATAARLQALPWSILLLGWVAWRSRSSRQAVLAVGSWLLGALPWWFKNMILLGDPLAPVFWQREGSETLWRDAGSFLKAGFGIFGTLGRLPSLLSSELLYLAPMLLLVVVAARRGSGPRFLAALAIAGLLFWPLTGALLRFLTPTILLIAMAVSVVKEGTIWRIAAVAALLGCGCVGVVRSVDLFGMVRPFSLLHLSNGEAASRVLPNDPQLAFEKAHALPPSARVLMVAEPRGFGFPRAFVTPSQHDPSPLREILTSCREPSDAVRRLREEGLTHILVNWRELDRLARDYPVTPWRDERTELRWAQLLYHIGPPVLTQDDLHIYSLAGDR